MHSGGVVVSMTWAMEWVPVQVQQHGKSMACIKIPVAGCGVVVVVALIGGVGGCDMGCALTYIWCMM